MRNLPHGFDIYLNSKRQNHEEDCTNFCGLLRKAELYLLEVDSGSSKILYHGLNQGLFPFFQDFWVKNIF